MNDYTEARPVESNPNGNGAGVSSVLSKVFSILWGENEGDGLAGKVKYGIDRLNSANNQYITPNNKAVAKTKFQQFVKFLRDSPYGLAISIFLGVLAVWLYSIVKPLFWFVIFILAFHLLSGIIYKVRGAMRDSNQQLPL